MLFTKKIRKMKKIIYTLLILFLGVTIYAQQETILTKYTFNSLFFNPAFAGSRGEDVGSVTLQYRNQWLGIEGAPTTYLLGGEKSFFDHSVGIGASVSNESIGANSHTEGALNLNYKIKLKTDSYLAGGLRGSFSNISSNFLELQVREIGDIYDAGSEQINIFSAGAGLLYHDETLHIGVSVPALISVSDFSIERNRHLYAHATMHIGDEYSTLRWVPSMLVKYQKAVPLQITLGAQAWVNDMFAPGIHWRVGESIALSLEVELNDELSLTAAYDFTTNNINDYGNGSLEMMFSWIFGKDERRKME